MEATIIQGDFPYEEIRQPNGDYFPDWQAAKNAGFNDNQIWSVTDAEGDDGSEWIITGPPHHYINHIGHIATKEQHDDNTYYEECWRPPRKSKKKKTPITKTPQTK
jgi:hypothetical protein